MLRHVDCDTPVPLNGTGKELTSKMAWQGRPTIGLFTELSQVHVTQGDGMCVWHFVAAMCPMNLNSFEFMWHVAATCHGIKLYGNIHVTRGDLSQGRVAPISHVNRLPCVTGSQFNSGFSPGTGFSGVPPSAKLTFMLKCELFSQYRRGQAFAKWRWKGGNFSAPWHTSTTF